MGSSLIKNMNGSNPSVQIPASDSMRIGMSASNPSIRSHLSDPSISSVTGSSISSIRKRTRFLPIFLVALLLLTMLFLAFGLIHLTRSNQARLDAVAKQEQAAAEIKHITAQPLRVIHEAVEETNTHILFSLYSNPEGADVYKDGLFIGKTPLDQYKIPRNSRADAHIVVAMDGYQVYRNDISLGENFFETVSLEQIVIRQRETKQAESPENTITQRGVIINTPKRKNSKGSGTVITASPDSGIALPD